MLNNSQIMLEFAQIMPSIKNKINKKVRNYAKY